tara:strand:- start:407 stop:532 length:126 start_codon:yes stop_codon:yes gene_type:complete
LLLLVEDQAATMVAVEVPEGIVLMLMVKLLVDNLQQNLQKL